MIIHRELDDLLTPTSIVGISLLAGLLSLSLLTLTIVLSIGKRSGPIRDTICESRHLLMIRQLTERKTESCTGSSARRPPREYLHRSSKATSRLSSSSFGARRCSSRRHMPRSSNKAHAHRATLFSPKRRFASNLRPLPPPVVSGP